MVGDEKRKHFSNLVDLVSNTSLKIVGSRRSPRIFKAKINNTLIVQKAHSKKKTKMSMSMELNETIQVDSEPDKDLGGELIDNS